MYYLKSNKILLLKGEMYLRKHFTGGIITRLSIDKVMSVLENI